MANKRNDPVQARSESNLSHDGRGVVKYNERVYFVDGVLADEEVVFTPFHKKRGQFTGRLEEIIKVVKHTLDMNDIELVLEFAENLPPVKGDSRQLQQVFLNLTNNAVAAMRGGGMLTIRTYFERRSRKTVVQFQDNGIGIRQEDLDHIFEPFFTTKPEGEGTGLGLFVSYGIIGKYGGSIDCVSHTADSQGKPGGTSFTLKFLTKKRGS